MGWVMGMGWVSVMATGSATGSAPSRQVTVVGQQAALDVHTQQAPGGRHSKRHVVVRSQSLHAPAMGMGWGWVMGEGDWLGDGW